MAKKTVEDIQVAGKRVLCRVDFNVPLTEDMKVADDKRIVAAMPTIQYLLDHEAKVILCSHLGRPKGKVDMKYTLAPVAARLQELLPKVRVQFASDTVGESAQKCVADMKDGEIVLLENTRFQKEEEANDPEFSRKLADLADIFVSDAFGTVHRAHASTAGVAAYLPAVAGFLIGKELGIMGEALNNPKRPFVAILGGAKVSDKIGVIKNLLEKCDTLLIGGGMAYTFYKAMGYEIGNSLLDENSIDLANELMANAKAKGVNLMLPVDTVVATEFNADAEYKTVPSNAIPAGWMGMDIGEETRAKYAEVIKAAKTVIWNGPMGVFEFPNFAKGTSAVAEACAECKGTTIIGGGDSASAVKKLGFAKKMTHISTGGGASLEFLEGKVLPGVAVLNDKITRRPIIAGNWKMNKTPEEAKTLVSELIPLVKDAKCDVVVCPPFVDLCPVSKLVEGTNIHLGCQNIHWAESGAYTGEISPSMLKAFGVEYAIIGHSERRAYFGETDEGVNKRAKAALANGIVPIICVGETLEQREAGVTESFVSGQTAAAFEGIPAEEAVKVVIAYEPIWAIGTGKTATKEDANATIAVVRRTIAGIYGEEVAQQVRIQYGGSMKPSNATELMSMPEIDGGLIGGASLKAVDFAGVVNY